MIKKLYKKLFVFSLLLACVFSINVSASSTEVYGSTEEEINAMSHEEFMDYIASVITLEVPFDELQENLEKVGVTITRSEDNQNTRASISSDASLMVYSSKRAGTLYYYLSACVTANKSLASDCGVEDLISIEWDPNMASYYSNSATTNTTYMDGSKRSKGVILFNVQDKNLTAGSTAICSAMVTPKKSGTLEYGSKYVHTYTKTDYSWNVGVNISYSEDSGATGGGTYNVTGTPASYSWQLYQDNAVTVSK